MLLSTKNVKRLEEAKHRGIFINIRYVVNILGKFVTHVLYPMLYLRINFSRSNQWFDIFVMF